MFQDTPLVIVGGSSPVGSYFLQILAASGLQASVMTRRPLKVPEGCTNVIADLSAPTDWALPQGATIFSFVPLWILSDFLPRFTEAKAIIAIGSTSLFSKARSDDDHERSVAAKLEAGEHALRTWAEPRSIQWTVLRPTIIYDGKTDKNITRMAHFIRRWRFLPLAAPAQGLRQPIHSEDVAKAAFKCLNNPAAANKAFNISGSEVLTYREMATRVCGALNMKPSFLMLPPSLLKTAFKMAAFLGVIKEASFGAAIFQRMNEDLVFDTSEGLKILDYQPRPFHPVFPNKPSS